MTEQQYDALYNSAEGMLTTVIEIIAGPTGEPEKERLSRGLAAMVSALIPFGLDWVHVRELVQKATAEAAKKKMNAELAKIFPEPDNLDDILKPSMRHTVTGKTPTLPDDAPAPQPINPLTGQHGDHWVLSPEERSRGFIRPVRLSYRHVGPEGPQYPLRDLTEEEKKLWGEDYAKYEHYPDNGCGRTGRFWTQAELDKIGKGCNSVTTMPRPIAETYAVKPSSYGRTFCCACRDYLPIAEFVWDGTNERVGT